MAFFGLLHPLAEMTVFIRADEARIVASRWMRAHAAFNSIGSKLA